MLAVLRGIIIFTPFITVLLAQSGPSECGWSGVNRESCTRLEPIFTYSQDEAPKDISAVVAIMTNKVNRELTRVSKIEVRQEDPTQSFPLGNVGEHLMIATVKRLTDNNVEEELCFHVRFLITDVNECTVPASHPMASRCHSSVECVNTQGSYECRCPAGSFGLPDAGASMGQCTRALDTSCCNEGMHMGKKDIQTCKASFRCFEDKCPGDCVPESLCISSQDGKSFTCQCQEPYVGNGHQCIGPTPTVWKSKLGALITGGQAGSCQLAGVCGCTLPKTDHCHEVNCGANAFCVNSEYSHQCVCNESFKMIEGMGCTNTKVPTLILKGSNPLRLSQCDSYEEHGVDIVDLNEEAMSRNVDIEYSEPLGSCLRKLGHFHVNYTLQTPWGNRPFIRVTRAVEVTDVDECVLSEKVGKLCPECQQRCVAEARCSNTNGSYSCTCPPCMEGDGFMYGSLPGATPDGYSGGTQCRDSCAPAITVPEPFYFRIPKCYGLMGPAESSLCYSNRDFEQELNRLVSQTNGKALCSQGQVCVHASDNTGIITVDVTDRIVIGQAIPLPSKLKDEFAFHVPYDVSDEAGNSAKTVYRKVIIQAKSLDDVEQECKDSCDKGTLGCPKCPLCTDKSCPECKCQSCHEPSVQGQRSLTKSSYFRGAWTQDLQSFIQNVSARALLQLFMVIAGIFSTYILYTYMSQPAPHIQTPIPTPTPKRTPPRTPTTPNSTASKFGVYRPSS